MAAYLAAPSSLTGWQRLLLAFTACTAAGDPALGYVCMGRSALGVLCVAGVPRWTSYLLSPRAVRGATALLAVVFEDRSEGLSDRIASEPA